MRVVGSVGDRIIVDTYLVTVTDDKTNSKKYYEISRNAPYLGDEERLAFNPEKSVEMSLRESGIELPKYSDRTKPVWGEASKSFAKSACGIVILLNQGFISDQSIWKNVEYDALKNNP